MAEEQLDIFHATYLSLGSSKDTVAISPSKKRKRQPLCLFGKMIYPGESSSLESDDETAMSLVDDSVSLELSLVIAGSYDVTCAGIKKDLTEDARKSKRMRSLSKEEKRAARLLTESPPYPWTIMKTLTNSDVNNLSRLMLDTKDAETHIVSHLPADVQNKIQEGIRIKVKAYDHQTETEHDLVIKRHVKTSKSYVLNGGWAAEFVKRRSLMEGDRITLFWDNTDSRFHFRVLERNLIGLMDRIL